jgi:DNA-binding CsgD family transcriptional regulator
MHLDDLWALGASASREELRERLLRLMGELGFERMAAHLFIDSTSPTLVYDTVDNTPANFLDTWGSVELGRRCPVMQHAKRFHTPIIYGQSTYVAAGAATTWEVQAPFGYAAGIAGALHLPNGRHVVVGLDRDKDLPSDPPERYRLSAGLTAILAHVAGPATALLERGTVSRGSPARLTPRERQVLQWTALGKSASMVAEITNLSFSTVNFHLRNATHKLGCNNKHVAACRAQALGLIST